MCLYPVPLTVSSLGHTTMSARPSEPQRCNNPGLTYASWHVHAPRCPEACRPRARRVRRERRRLRRQCAAPHPGRARPGARARSGSPSRPIRIGTSNREIPDREGDRGGGQPRLRGRRDPAPADGRRNARIPEPVEAGGLPPRPVAADALHPPGLRLAGRRRTAKHVAHTKHCIDLAAQMGIPAIRLNSGRWKTIESFDDLMKVKGNEPPMQGYTTRTLSAGASTRSARACRTPKRRACCSRSRITGASPPTSTCCCASTRRSTRRGSASTSTPATSRAIRTRAREGRAARHDRSGQDLLRRRRMVHARPGL